MAALDFTHESKTYLNFANDYQFCLFRQWIEDNYDPRMVQIERSRVYKDFTVEGMLKHAQGLGAELRGAKVNMFGS